MTTVTAAARDVPVAAECVAQMQSSQAVNVQARVSGFLDKHLCVEGSLVKAGQVLFQMDQKPFQAQVDAARAAMQRNEAALGVAKASLERTKPLAEQEALSQKGDRVDILGPRFACPRSRTRSRRGCAAIPGTGSRAPRAHSPRVLATDA